LVTTRSPAVPASERAGEVVIEALVYGWRCGHAAGTMDPVLLRIDAVDVLSIPPLDGHLVTGWVEQDLTAVKVHELLGREGVVVPVRTVQRYVAEVFGRRRGRGPTVRVADGEPGEACQVDFGKMGLVPDPATGRRRVAYALIFTAGYSRYPFV
jgi:hypothetical protein